SNSVHVERWVSTECEFGATAVSQASHLRLGPVAAVLPAVSLFDGLQSALPALSTGDTIPGHNDERLNQGNLLGESGLRCMLHASPSNDVLGVIHTKALLESEPLTIARRAGATVARFARERLDGEIQKCPSSGVHT
ncbi:hypothetical protein L916_18569, partial [Phytophthora nicotianae]